MASFQPGVFTSRKLPKSVPQKLGTRHYRTIKGKKPSVHIVTDTKYINGEVTTVYVGFLMLNVRKDKSSVFLPMSFINDPQAPLLEHKMAKKEGKLLIFNQGFDIWHTEEEGSSTSSSPPHPLLSPPSEIDSSSSLVTVPDHQEQAVYTQGNIII